MRTFKRILGVLLIFVFGVFVGGVVTSAGAMQKLRETLLGGPEAVMDVVVKRLDHELKLDDEQKRKLQGIVDDARIQLRQSHAKIRPEVEQTLREAEERTRAILYPTASKEILTRGSARAGRNGRRRRQCSKATPAPDDAGSDYSRARRRREVAESAFFHPNCPSGCYFGNVATGLLGTAAPGHRGFGWYFRRRPFIQPYGLPGKIGTACARNSPSPPPRPGRAIRQRKRPAASRSSHRPGSLAHDRTTW